MQIDLELLLRAAQMTGALQGNTRTYGPPQIMGKEASLTESTLASFYGCCGLFDMCGSNDLLSLTIEGEPFLDWLGWKPNNECKQFVKMISYIGPAGTYNDSEASGAVAACSDGAGVEFGTCEVLLPDKGRIKRCGPVRDLTENNRKPCDEYPVFNKQGVRITDELMWSLTLAGIAIKQDIKRMVVTGNVANTGEFSGLEALVNTGYRDARNGVRCSAMDSYVLNWGNNTMATAVNGFALIDYLVDIVRRIRARAMMANLGGIALGDQVIVLPSYLRDCLLDVYTCWSVCPGSQYNETNMNTYEARTFRNTLNGGPYGMGQIYVDGTPLPIITYDWLPMAGAGAGVWAGDMYILTRKLGNMPVLWGQYIDMTDPASSFAAEAGYAHYKALDGGKYLAYWKTDNECTQSCVLIRPNIYLSAPWAQARIMDVACSRPLNPISSDPTSTYYAEQYLGVAYCPEDYLLTSPAR
jgi:hypothetical protein